MKNTTMIKETDKAYFRRLNRNLVLEEILRFFRQKSQAENLTQRQLATRLHMDAGQLSRILREPSNLKLDTVSDLLLGMNAEFRFTVVPQSRPQSADEFMKEFESFLSAANSDTRTNVVPLRNGPYHHMEHQSETSSNVVATWNISDQEHGEVATN